VINHRMWPTDWPPNTMRPLVTLCQSLGRVMSAATIWGRVKLTRPRQ